MDINEADDEKYLCIRQTIRRVILPLVQDIYNEDPSDVILFCFRYFEDQLRKRESDKNVVEDANPNSVKEYSNKKDADKYIQKTNESREMGNVPSTNIQGSASVPLLASEKHCEGLSLRETSSWNLPPNHLKSGGSRVVMKCNLADAMCGIGDQPCAIINDSEKLKTDAKAGDVDCSLKSEDKIFESGNYSENQTSLEVIRDSKGEEVQKSSVLPSSLPHEESAENFQQAQTELENPEFSVDGLTNQKIKQNVRFDDGKTDEFTESLKSCVSCSSSLVQTSTEKEGKVSSKPLSPNSSYGFIPHLKENETEEETRNAYSEFSKDLDFQMKTSEEIKELAEKISETFQGLAENFNSAENNLNDEFKKAKEISDIIQVRYQTEETSSKLILDSNINNETMNKEDKVDTSLHKNSFDRDTNVNNNLINKVNESVYESESTKLADNTRAKTYNSEEKIDGTRNVYNSPVEYENRTETAKHSLKQENNINMDEKEDAEIDHKERISTFRNCRKEDGNRLNSMESRTVVDESWMKKWYEVHPCLDNMSTNFQQGAQRLHRSQRVFLNNRRNLIGHNIGEAGDVPPDIFYDPESTSVQSVGGSESNNETNATSPTTEEYLYGRLSFEENRWKGNKGRTTRNISNRDLTNTSTSGITSQNIPCSGRQMSKYQASYLETEKQVLKQMRKTLGEKTIDSESKAHKNLKGSKSASHENETLSEIIDENGKVNEASLTSSQSMSQSKMEQVSCEEQVNNCERNLAQGNTQYVSNTNDENLKNDDTHSLVSKEYSDIIEVPQESLCHELEKQLNSIHNGPSEEYNHNDPVIDHYKKVTITESLKAMEGKMADSKVVSSEIKGDSNTSQRSDDSLKVEPGLNSACGDFTSSLIQENNEGNISEIAAENGSISSRSTEQNNTGVGVQAITAEYVEEIIEKALDPQVEALRDSFESLTFSSYSEESESSNIESDSFSENDDMNLNSKMCKP